MAGIKNPLVSSFGLPGTPEDPTNATTASLFDENATLSTEGIRYEELPAFRISVYIRLAATIILVPTATVGNILSFVVMQRKALRGTTTSLYLSYLALADLVTIYVVCVPDTVAKVNGIYIDNLSNFMCVYWNIQRQFLITLTSWILLLLAVERAISVFFPVQVRQIFSFRNSIFIASGATTFLLSVSLRMCWTRRVVQLPAGRACRPIEPYFYAESKIFPYVIRSLYWIIPFVVMVICNTCIVVKIRMMTGIHSGRRSRKITSNTVIMIVTTVTFCVLCSPQTLFYQFNPGWNYAPPLLKARYELGFAICQVLSYTNNAINFFLYVASGPRFRNELMRVLRMRTATVAPLEGHSFTLTEDGKGFRTPDMPESVRRSGMDTTGIVDVG